MGTTGIQAPTEATLDMLWRMEEAFKEDTGEVMLGLFSEDVLLMGASATAVGHEQSSLYIAAAMGVVDHVEWDYGSCWTLTEGEGLVVAAATGEIVFKGGERRAAYRLTFTMREQDGLWKVTLFHGSSPPE